MKKKCLVLMRDDFEIIGNGPGTFSDFQYLPALALTSVAEEFLTSIGVQDSCIRWRNRSLC